MAEPADIMGQDGFLPGSELLPREQNNIADQELSVGANNIESSDSPLKFQDSISNALVETRPISAIRFHRKFEGIVVTSHTQRTDGKSGAPQGSVSVWSLRDGSGVLQRSLIARTPVTALDLPLISPTLVIAGTVGGSVLVWDTRVKTSLPISCNAKNGTSFDDFHDRQAVTGVTSTSFVSQYFVTTSKDGYVCKWSLSNLDCPVDRSTLQASVGAGSLGIESMDLPHTTRLAGNQRSGAGRSTSMFIGGQCGGVFRAEERGSSWNLCDGNGQHEAPVTSVSAHPFGARNPFLKDTVISSSKDWTVRLWNVLDDTAVQLCTFDMISKGVVSEVAWSPQHPTIFCACSEVGKLSLFDVSNQISPSGGVSWDYSPPGSSPCRLTTVRWSDDSRFICTGDRDGKLSIWTCKSSVSGLPDADWMGQFVRSKFARNARTRRQESG